MKRILMSGFVVFPLLVLSCGGLVSVGADVESPYPVVETPPPPPPLLMPPPPEPRPYWSPQPGFLPPGRPRFQPRPMPANRPGPLPRQNWRRYLEPGPVMR
ncbi:MAG: hypothetical protein WCQ55_06530 [Paludibacteraceae bacterium]